MGVLVGSGCDGLARGKQVLLQIYEALNCKGCIDGIARKASDSMQGCYKPDGFQCTGMMAVTTERVCRDMMI